MEEPTQPDKQLTPQFEELLQAFISVFAHEVRPSLISLKGGLQFILEEKFGPLNEQQRDYLTSIYQVSQKLLRDYNEFFDICRLLFQWSFHLRIEEVDLGELIKLAVSEALQDPRISDWFVRSWLEQSIPPNLPHVSIDRLRIQGVLAAILSEIMYITNSGEGNKIVLLVNYDDSWVTCNIRAVGVSDPHYFDGNPNALTLFYSRSIIEMHGGQMQVNLQEELNQLEISFTLPIEQNKPHPE